MNENVVTLLRQIVRELDEKMPSVEESLRDVDPQQVEALVKRMSAMVNTSPTTLSQFVEFIEKEFVLSDYPVGVKVDAFLSLVGRCIETLSSFHEVT